jgi:hypothetical protein
MTIVSNKSIIEKIKSFHKAELNFIEFTYEHKKPTSSEEIIKFLAEASSLAETAYRLWLEILLEVKDVPSIENLPAKEKSILDKIQDEVKSNPDKSYFQSINFLGFIENIGEESSKKPTAEEQIIDFMGDGITQTFDQDFLLDFTEYYDFMAWSARRAVVGAILSDAPVPKNVIQYFEEIKESYSLFHYRACIALCRALLEISLYKELKRTGWKPPYRQNIYINQSEEEVTLSRLIATAFRKRLLDGKNKEKAHSIRKAGNQILHPAATKEQTISELTLGIIRDTVSVLNCLFSR